MMIRSLKNEKNGLQHIAAFLESVSENYANDLLFRGHASNKWKLIPSAFRGECYGIVHYRMLKKWKSVAARFSISNELSDLSALVLAQHHGIASPLLDWTTNPLVALFFACQPIKSEQESSQTRFELGEVLQVDRACFDSISDIYGEDIFQEIRDKAVIFETAPMNSRANAQDSVMSLQSKEITHPINAKSIYTISPDAKSDIRHALFVMGLSPERIYADIDVAARQYEDNMWWFQFME